MSGNHRSGRARKSAAEHRQRGTYKPGRHGRSDDEVQADGVPKQPVGLSADAAWLWRQIVADRVEAGVVKACDGPMLWSMCELWGLYRAAVKVAKKHPTDKDARIAVISYRQAFDSVASRFGLTPADRLRLRGVVEPAREDSRVSMLPTPQELRIVGA